MSSGGGSSQPTSTTVQNTNIPEYLKGPILDIAGKAKALYDAPVKGYEEGVPIDQRIGRVAGFDPAQEAAFRGIASMGMPQGFQDANRALDVAQGRIAGMQDPNQYVDANRALDMAQGRIAGMQDPAAYNKAQQAYNQAQAGISGLGTPQDFAVSRDMLARDADFDTQRFGAKQAAYYMNPYVNQVLNVSARQATEASAREAARSAARFASMGTYGGYGQNVAEAIRQRTLSQDIGDLYTKGLGEAYDKAAALYGEDEARRLSAAEFRRKGATTLADLGKLQQDTDLARYAALQEAGARQQGLGSERQKMALERADALRQMGLSQADVGSKQQADRLARAEALRAIGLSQSEMGAAQQEANLKRLTAKSEVGKQRQALEQYKKDIAYQDYLRQRDLPMEKLAFYSNIIRGLTPTIPTSTAVYGAQPSPASIALGAGLSGLGYFNALKGAGVTS